MLVVRNYGDLRAPRFWGAGQRRHLIGGARRQDVGPSALGGPLAAEDALAGDAAAGAEPDATFPRALRKANSLLSSKDVFKTTPPKSLICAMTLSVVISAMSTK